MEEKANKITVVGAGLAGCMMALLLAQKGEHVVLLESREDFRKVEQKDGEGGRFANSIKRSINLALSFRGISALKKVGLFDKIQDKLIPMKGRVIHKSNGTTSFQAYGTGDQAIFSISRMDINRLLLDELEKYPQVEKHFGVKVTNVDKSATVTVMDNTGKQQIFPSRLVIGADGAYSSVRRALQKLVRMDISISHLSSGYKELTIPAKNGDFALENWQGLHIWPRQQHMFIALPNADRTFTCTLFTPWEGEYSAASVKTDEEILAYFERYYKDMISLIPDLVQQFKESPISPLLTIKASPWNFEDKVVLIGDAAHSAVPFYGQGMNCAFEDALLLTELMESNNNDLKKTLTDFHEQRVPGGHALGQLSLDNWAEMQDKSASSYYQLKRKLDATLHAIAPSFWVPKYSMVAFTRMPYQEAVAKAKKQEKILDTLLIGTATTALVAASSLLYFTSLNKKDSISSSLSSSFSSASNWASSFFRK